LKKLLVILILGILLSGNAFSANKYFYLKCPENIKKVRISSTGYDKEGDLIGTNYVKLKSESKITIHFSYDITKSKPHIVVENLGITNEGLGFSVTEEYKDKEIRAFEYFKFIKIKNEYAFLRTSKWWNAKTKEYDESELDYDSTGKCENIDKKDYKKFLKG